MVIGLIVSSVLLISLLLNAVQYIRNRRLYKDIRSITQKLHSKHEQASDETLLVPVASSELKLLLAAINQMAAQQTQTRVQFRRRERSIQMMLANISHDLKTPLTVVLGYIETLQNDPHMSETERNRLLGQMHQKTWAIIDIMNTFFDVAKLEAGDTDMPLQRINLSEIAKQGLLSHYETIQNKGLEPVIAIPDKPVWIHGNEDALNRIVQNLITNAIDYGSEGGVVGLTLTPDTEHAKLAIWDRGRGIPRALQAHIFERMFTVEESRNKSFQGSGLGLYITKRLVDQMNGTITLESTPYHLTRFNVTFKQLTY